MTAGVTKRLLHYFAAAESMRPDLILMTCSSAGEVVDFGRRTIDTVPLLRIDEPMAAEAVRSARRVGVLATLPTTLDPTVRLIRQQAAMIGKEVEVVDGLAEGAYQTLRQGQPERHDEMIIEIAVKIAHRSDVFVLAQASMARVEAKIRKRTGKPVLSSPSRVCCISSPCSAGEAPSFGWLASHPRRPKSEEEVNARQGEPIKQSVQSGPGHA